MPAPCFVTPVTFSRKEIMHIRYESPRDRRNRIAYERLSRVTKWALFLVGVALYAAIYFDHFHK